MDKIVLSGGTPLSISPSEATASRNGNGPAAVGAARVGASRGIAPGVQVHSNRATFTVWAPHATGGIRVRVNGTDHELDPIGDGYFRRDVAGAKHNDRYRYVFPNGKALPDPASWRQPDGPNGDSQIFDPSKVVRTQGNWRGLSLETKAAFKKSRSPSTVDQRWLDFTCRLLALRAESSLSNGKAWPTASVDEQGHLIQTEFDDLRWTVNVNRDPSGPTLKGFAPGDYHVETRFGSTWITFDPTRD